MIRNSDIVAHFFGKEYLLMFKLSNMLKCDKVRNYKKGILKAELILMGKSWYLCKKRNKLNFNSFSNIINWYDTQLTNLREH